MAEPVRILAKKNAIDSVTQYPVHAGQTYPVDPGIAQRLINGGAAVEATPEALNELKKEELVPLVPDATGSEKKEELVKKASKQ